MPRTHQDPRALRSRAAALAAATELLVEGGPENVTHATVAQRAGIGRATVYRHWPDQQTLLIDALANDVRPLLTFDNSPVRDQLVTQLQRQTDWLNRPVSASVIATVIERAERDEDARRIREDMFGREDQHFTEALTAAVQRGELRTGVQAHARELISRIIGPLFFRRSMLGERLDKDTVTGEVDTALAPWLPNT
ncbi:TetR/AcrR family transcriptional regulator [Streptomyces sp. NL15-2K]|uniref:TetR/AcrR family transcriptional regulator n=1 Tax=Streptomyces sp. NL15-2K TaxID=376149 RepID=UPI000F5802DA|nr:MULTISPECIES: TetR/AcrR family transcriptional regulator [Actinomycetes]WKX11065.1 TetR/AcrR family transcriptional regulator [Kutzneria buriramensis]GCB52095.1 tetR family transcriptional regulator [Streptomyces sp. NL15-2K]